MGIIQENQKKIKETIVCCDEPKYNQEVDLSIIIACRGETWPTLAMTLQSIQEERQDINWECIVVFNDKEIDSYGKEAEERFYKSNFRKFSHFRYCKIKDSTSSIARNVGIYNSIGKYIYIGDPHMIIGKDCFKQLLETFKNLKNKGHDVGILHTSLGWLSGVHHKDLCDQYTPKLKQKFWGNWSKSGNKEPHTICMKGTSFMMNRLYALQIGMYNMNFQPYGGNEPYINLKTWRFGQEVWVEPRSYVWHLAYARGYKWTNDIYFYNQMLASYTIGGSNWLQHIFFRFCKEMKDKHNSEIANKYIQGLKILKNDVVKNGEEDRKFIESFAKYTLDELIEQHGWA